MGQYPKFLLEFFFNFCPALVLCVKCLIQFSYYRLHDHTLLPSVWKTYTKEQIIDESNNTDNVSKKIGKKPETVRRLVQMETHKQNYAIMIEF